MYFNNFPTLWKKSSCQKSKNTLETASVVNFIKYNKDKMNKFSWFLFRIRNLRLLEVSNGK